MNTQLQASKVSSLIAVLTKPEKVDSTRYVQGTKKAYQNEASEMLFLESSSQPTQAGGSCKIQISKAGILRQAWLKVTLSSIRKGFNDTAQLDENGLSSPALVTTLSCADWLAPAIVSNVDLVTHSHTLLSLDSHMICKEINEAEPSLSSLYKIASGYHLSSNSRLNPTDAVTKNELGLYANADGRITLYLPLLFTPMKGDTKNLLFAQFNETMSFSVSYRNVAKYFKAVLANTNNNFGISDMKLDIQAMCKYTSLVHKEMKEALTANFSLTGSIQAMYNDYRKVISETKEVTGINSGNQKCKVTLSSNETILAREAIVLVYKEPKAGEFWSSDLISPDLVTFRGSGRELFRLSGVEAKLWNSSNMKSTFNSIFDSGTSAPVVTGDKSSNYFSYSWANDKNGGYYSSALATSGVSSQSWEVEWTVPADSAGDDTATYNVQVIFGHIQVVSIQGSDGRILTALST